uniref:Uncharacterized protein n=1 Tax=Rhipicephalus zambeziensis TaxID=60191 RepID=A0A224YJR6_9ACAR
MKAFRQEIAILLGSFILLSTLETTCVVAVGRRWGWQDPRLDFTFPANNAWRQTYQGQGNNSPSLQKLLKTYQTKRPGFLRRLFQRRPPKPSSTHAPQLHPQVFIHKSFFDGSQGMKISSP